MKIKYVNPLLKYPDLNDEIIQLIEDEYNEFRNQAIEDFKKTTEGNHALKLLKVIEIENDMADFYSKINQNDKAIYMYLGVMDKIKEGMESSLDKFFTLHTMEKVKLTRLYSKIGKIDNIINLNEYYFDFFSNLDCSEENIKNKLLGLTKIDLGKAYFDYGDLETAESDINDGIACFNFNQNADIIIYAYNLLITINSNNEEKLNQIYKKVYFEFTNLSYDASIRIKVIDIIYQYASKLYSKHKAEALDVLKSIVNIINLEEAKATHQKVFCLNVLLKIAKIYDEAKDYTNANIYNKQAYQLISQDDLKLRQENINTRTIMGLIAEKSGDLDFAIQVYNDNIEHLNSQELKEKDYGYLSQMYLHLIICCNDVEKRLDYAMKACEVLKEVKKSDYSYLGMYLDIQNIICQCYYQLKMYDRCINNSYALIEEVKLYNDERSSKMLTEIYERLTTIFILDIKNNYSNCMNDYTELFELYTSEKNYIKFIKKLNESVCCFYEHKNYDSAIVLLYKYYDIIDIHLDEMYNKDKLKLLGIIGECLIDNDYKVEDYKKLLNFVEERLIKLYEEKTDNELLGMIAFDLYNSFEKYLLKINKDDHKSLFEISLKRLSFLNKLSLNSDNGKEILASSNEKLSIICGMVGLLDNAVSRMEDAIELYEKINYDEKYAAKLVKMNEMLKYLKNLKKNKKV